MAMLDAQNAMRLLNPWAFNLQKLGIELKCPSCLDLLNRPVLLPCNHIFCNSCVPKSSQPTGRCAACQQHFTDAEIRSAPYMENIVAIYQSLNATFNSSILPVLSTGHQLKNISSEMSAGGKNNHAEAILFNHVECAAGLNKGPVSDELVVKHPSGMFPESSPSSSAAKETARCNSDPGSGNMITKNQELIKTPGEDLGTSTGEVNCKDTFPTREAKRQKKLDYGSSETVPQNPGLGLQKVSNSDEAAISNCNEHKFKEETSVISSLAPCDASSYINGSACAFCQSSKITEGTGSLLHYLNGKVVGKDDNGFSNAIPVHLNCIEWTPQVYFSGDKIKNLESELARASKLKCSRCGLKGAALGCFAKSCRRTYHVPCAVEIPGCRWNCEDFVMLCPAHKSIKFPNEKKSRKHHVGEKRCLSTQSVSEQPDFWATSIDGPQKWVFCGSALSSEEKCLVGKFATICGATVSRTWSTDVTHVIAATDSNGACSRTLKVLMAILHGMWILTMDWIRDCVEANCPMNEEPYEVNLDNHGFRDGPKTGRLRASTNAPKLFDGLNFYFNGEFIPSFKNDLLELVRVGGGIVIESMNEIAMQIQTPALVVYNHDLQGSAPAEVSCLVLNRLGAAKDVAKDINARVIPHTWILESIAACRVLA